MEKVCSVCKTNFVEVHERQLSAASLVDMINKSFYFSVTTEDIHYKNICELCTADVRAAYRFQRNYVLNVKLKKNELGSLEAENWDFVRDSDREDQESISDDSAKPNEPSHLIEHEQTHTGVLPCTCPYCQKPFVSRSAQRRHERVHTGEKPYKCEHCQKAFTRLSSLKVHQRLHTGDKPYICPNCQKAFITKSAQRQHLKIHT